MQRLLCEPRPDWQQRVEQHGLVFHTTDDGTPYWDESACYVFTSREIDVLEQATYALNDLCLKAVEQIIARNLWEQFQVPPAFVDFVRKSWDEDDESVYGRFDLLYDGVNPPKLLEYNADTPTALLEASVIQWYWLQDTAPEADQFNSIHERLLDIWRILKDQAQGPYTFCSLEDHVEDFMTVNYLRDVAIQAGLETQYLSMEQIGWNASAKQFIDPAERPMPHIFKLYPWEWMFRERFGAYPLEAPTRWLEAPWKVLLSNKALLPLLHELFPDHPNVLPASWQPLPGACVRKPTQGREGANVRLMDGDKIVEEAPGPYYKGPFIYQEFFPTPRHDGRGIVIGSWLVNGYACGIGVREDDRLITSNTSRFVPHRMG